MRPEWWPGSGAAIPVREDPRVDAPLHRVPAAARPLRCGATADQNPGWFMGQGADVVDGLGDPYLERAAGGAAGWVDEDVSGHGAPGEVHRPGVGVSQGTK